MTIFFAQHFFRQTFAYFLRMKRNESFAVLRNLRKPDFFCAICAKPEVLRKRNFFSKLTKIEILSTELNN